jgi:hypothetical protein
MSSSITICGSEKVEETSRLQTTVAHLFDDAIGHTWQVLFIEIHEDDASLETSSQVEQGVERQRRNMRSTPSVGALFHVLLVFDPTSSFLPLSVLASALQLIQLDEHLMRTVIDEVSFIDADDVLQILLALLLGSTGLWPTNPLGIFRSMRVQVVQVCFFKSRVFGLN